MKRILVYGMTNIRGGIETYVMSVFRAMDKTRIMFDFVTDFPSMVYEDEVQAAGAKIYYISAKRKHPLKQLREFCKLLKQHPEYETVYFNILSAGSFYNMIPAIIHKRYIIAHSHNGSTNQPLLHKLFQAPLNHFVNKKLACSELAARFMFGKRSLQPGEVTVINNAIDADKFRFNSQTRENKRKELDIEGRYVVCHVGRMDMQKNPLFLLDIFKSILMNEKASVLLYVGIGPIESEVKKYSKEIGISDSIKFLGMRNDISEIMNASDVFLLPSNYEGLPFVLIEAQVNGLPCLTSAKVVSSDVKITDLLEFIQLSDPPTFWAKQALKYKNMMRGDTFEVIKKAGYDIKTEVNKVFNILHR